jgi:hypothetical protein
MAFLAADFIWANIQIALFSGVWYMGFVGSFGAYIIYTTWTDFYIPFRVNQENKR